MTSALALQCTEEGCGFICQLCQPPEAETGSNLNWPMPSSAIRLSTNKVYTTMNVSVVSDPPLQRSHSDFGLHHSPKNGSSEKKEKCVCASACLSAVFLHNSSCFGRQT